MADERHERGRRGEDEAVRVLKKKGYRVLERNFRGRFGEIDIVAKDGKSVVFVEVKTRSVTAAGDYGTPGEAVGAKKRERIIKAAHEWLRRRKDKDCLARFDVVEVIIREDGDGEQGLTATIIEDAFGAEW